MPSKPQRNNKSSHSVVIQSAFAHIVVAVFFLAGCGKQEFHGAQEKLLVGWEQSRRGVEIATGEMADSIRTTVKTRAQKVFSVLTEKERRIIGDVEVEVLKAPTSMFVFESGYEFRYGRRRALIRTSSETAATLIKIVMASQVSFFSVDPDAWLSKYLLYIRGRSDGELILDPLRASGIINADGVFSESIDLDRFREADRVAKLKYDEVITFLVAHELAHLAYPRRPKSRSESAQDYNARARIDEARADSFALAALAKIERTLREPDGRRLPLYLVGAPQLFLQWIVTMQGVRHPLSPTTHPLDYIRGLSVISEIESHIVTLDLPKEEALSLLEILADSRAMLNSIEKEGVANFSAALDKEAKEVTVDMLRFVD